MRTSAQKVCKISTMTSATPDNLELLLKLQDKDNQILALHHEVKQLPEREEIKSIQTQQEELQKQIQHVEMELHINQRNQKRLEDEVATIEDRMQGQQNKLYGGEVQAIKELQALEADIDGLKERQLLVEDQIIEVMELNEPIFQEIDKLGNREVALNENLVALQKSLAKAIQELEKSIIHCKEERQDFANSIPEELLKEYEQIRKQPGRVGVALLSGSTCRGCHLDLPAVEVDRIKKLPNDTLINCEECSCILVR